MKKYVDKQDVIDLFKQLTPWEQEELKGSLEGNFDTMSEWDILNYFNIDPMDYFEPSELTGFQLAELVDRFDYYDLVDELFDNRKYELDPSDIINGLENSFEARPKLYTEEVIQKLEDFVKKVKNNYVEKQEML